MNLSMIDSYLFGNKQAVKTGIKISISVWGAFFIAVLMHMERPVWAMITGMISFFTPAHAQVLKKCIYQALSTLLAGVLGVALLSFTAQSPLLAALGCSVLVFIGAALAFQTRDSNFTFCCTVFTVTSCLMVMTPATFGPTSNFIINTFIDRVGTILCGVIWAGFVSACLWPVFSTDELRRSAGGLFGAVLALPQNFGLTADLRKKDFAQVYSGIIDHSDLADHCDFEGMWGRRGARVARKMNMLAIRICTHTYTLLCSYPALPPQGVARLQQLEDIARTIQSKGEHLQPADLQDLERFTTELAPDSDGQKAQTVNEELGQVRLGRLAQDLLSFVRTYVSLLRHEKVAVSVVRVRRYPQLKNCIRTGLRSMSLFLLTFTLWYATGWEQGFLIAVVPLVFSVALCKAPHPEIITKQVIIGTLVAIPVGLVVSSLLSQSSSAIELLIVTAGVVLFFGFMGLSSMQTFAYSIGFNISLLVFLLPQQDLSVMLNMPFAIERSFSIALGSAILCVLFVLIPKRAALKDPDNPRALFDVDLRRYLLTDNIDRFCTAQLGRRISLIIDKMVHVARHEAPDKKDLLLAHAGKCIFLMTQALRVETYIRDQGIGIASQDALANWRQDLYDSYVSGKNELHHPLVQQLGPVAERPENVASPWYSYLESLDHTTRSVFHLV